MRGWKIKDEQMGTEKETPHPWFHIILLNTLYYKGRKIYMKLILSNQTLIFIAKLKRWYAKCVAKLSFKSSTAQTSRKLTINLMILLHAIKVVPAIAI